MTCHEFRPTADIVLDALFSKQCPNSLANGRSLNIIHWYSFAVFWSCHSHLMHTVPNDLIFGSNKMAHYLNKMTQTYVKYWSIDMANRSKNTKVKWIDARAEQRMMHSFYYENKWRCNIILRNQLKWCSNMRAVSFELLNMQFHQ